MSYTVFVLMVFLVLRFSSFETNQLHLTGVTGLHNSAENFKSVEEELRLISDPLVIYWFMFVKSDEFFISQWATI